MDFNKLRVHLEDALEDTDTLSGRDGADDMEIAEAEATTADEVSEVNEAASDIEVSEAEDEATEMYYQHLEHMYAVIRERGLSKDVVACFDPDGSFMQMVESRVGRSVFLESTGNPGDTATRVALEGIGDMLKDAIEWIKKIFRKIFEFMGRLFAAIMARVSSAEKTLGRIKKRLSECSTYVDAAKDAKVIPVKSILKWGNGNADSSSFNDIVAKAEDTLNKPSIKSIMGARVGDSIKNRAGSAIGKYVEALDKEMKEYNKNHKPPTDTINVSEAWSSADTDCTNTINGNGYLAKLKRIVEQVKFDAKQQQAEADRLNDTSAGDGTGSKNIKEARDVARAKNKVASFISKQVSQLLKVQGLLIKSLSRIASFGKKD